MEPRQTIVRVKKIDERKRLVSGEVYAPNKLDTYGEFMLAEDIELMAHRFMRLDLSKTIDTQHDETPTSSYPVESFIAREGDPDYTPGSWVLVVKVADDEQWAKVLAGELNGYSFQCMVRAVSTEIKVQVVRDHVGQTEKSEEAPHDHIFFAQLNEAGRVIGGVTSKAADGHFHVIRGGTVTDEAAGHTHRFFL